MSAGSTGTQFMEKIRDAFVDRLLCSCDNVQDVLRAIEHEGPDLSAAQGAIGLHVLALSAAPLGKGSSAHSWPILAR